VTFKYSSPAATGILSAALLVSAFSEAAASGWLNRSSLYTTSAVNSFCENAQSVVASSDLEVSNVVYSKWTGFVGSDARPYSVVGGETELQYTPPESPDDPLTSTQHLFFGQNKWGLGEFPTVVSCKMKNAEYLNTVGLASDAVDQPCKAVNAETLGSVIAGMSRFERWRMRRMPGPVLDEDAESDRGSDWTAEFPDSPYPVLYREFPGGPLHIKASALYVSPHPDDIPAPGGNFIAFCNFAGGDQGFLGSACEPRKWGVRYCHLPSPEYLRNALTGRVEVPTCGTESADVRVCGSP
jgi:hypothetical protein